MTKTDCINEIRRLKKAHNILILAHYYVESDVQEVADIVGDSYSLSQVLLQAKEQIILVCSVKFVAENIKVLNPTKTILMPDLSIQCPMSYMTTPYAINQVRRQYRDLAVVAYVNSTSEIKALSDVCVTSYNAATVINKLKQKNIFFVPNKNLGQYLAKQLPHKNFILNNGFCYVYDRLTKDHLMGLSHNIPDAKIVAHPKYPLSILNYSDFIGSISEILDYITRSTHDKFIMCTEVGVFHKLIKYNPYKQFYLADNNLVCSNMKKISLEKVYHSLLTLGPELKIDPITSKKARTALERMVFLENS